MQLVWVVFGLSSLVKTGVMGAVAIGPCAFGESIHYIWGRVGLWLAVWHVVNRDSIKGGLEIGIG